MGLPADLESDGLAFLNALIESLNLDRLWVRNQLISTYTLVAGQNEYTIGPSGDLNGVRPLNIEQANIILNTVSPVLRQPLSIIGFREWSMIRVQQVSAIGNVLYYDRAFSSTGLGKVYLWPAPSQAYELELYTWQNMTAFADISTTSYTFSPGYERALTFLLAWEMLTMMPDKFKVGDKNWLLRMVHQSRQAIEDYNSQPQYMTVDPAFTSQNQPRGGFNYLTGGIGNGPGSF
jgi:hypothetical protein